MVVEKEWIRKARDFLGPWLRRSSAQKWLFGMARLLGPQETLYTDDVRPTLQSLEACQSGNASAASEAAAADRLPSAKSAHNPGMNFAVAPPGPLASVVS